MKLILILLKSQDKLKKEMRKQLLIKYNFFIIKFLKNIKRKLIVNIKIGIDA